MPVSSRSSGPISEDDAASEVPTPIAFTYTHAPELRHTKLQIEVEYGADLPPSWMQLIAKLAQSPAEIEASEEEFLKTMLDSKPGAEVDRPIDIKALVAHQGVSVIFKSPGAGATASGPVYWNIPNPVEHFVDRYITQLDPDDVTGEATITLNTLDLIEQSLATDQHTLITQTITGAGGVDKTQLAIAYARKAEAEKRYDVIVWLNAEGNLLSHYQNFAEEGLGVSLANKDQDELIQAVNHQLRSRGPILFVFDNVEAYEDIQPFIPQQGAAQHMDVLMTSRNETVPGKKIHLEVYSPKEAVDYIQRRLADTPTPPTQEEAESLAEALHYFPLALAQATAYIEVNEVSIEAYQAAYQPAQRALLEKHNIPDEYQCSVWATFDLSLQKLQEQTNGKQALEILDVCAYLAADDIPRDLFLPLIESDNPALELIEIINGLRRYSLVALTGSDLLQIHRLIQDIIRLRYEEQIKRQMHQLIVDIFRLRDEERTETLMRQILQDFFRLPSERQTKGSEEVASAVSADAAQQTTTKRHSESSPLKRAFDLLDRAFTYGKTEGSYQDLGVWEANQSLLAHIAAAVSHASEMPRLSEIAGRLGGNAGLLYGNLGDTHERRDLFERALAINESHYGPDHPQVAITLTNLGFATLALSDKMTARTCAQRALKIFQDLYKDPAHPHIQTAQRLLHQCQPTEPSPTDASPPPKLRAISSASKAEAGTHPAPSVPRRQKDSFGQRRPFVSTTDEATESERALTSELPLHALMARGEHLRRDNGEVAIIFPDTDSVKQLQHQLHGIGMSHPNMPSDPKEVEVLSEHSDAADEEYYAIVLTEDEYTAVMGEEAHATGITPH